MAIIILNKNNFESKIDPLESEIMYVNFNMDSAKFARMENKIFSTKPNKRKEKLKKYMKKFNVEFIKMLNFPQLKLKMEK